MEHGRYVEIEPVIDKFLSRGVNIYYFCGGRGIGKTYGALDLCRKIGTGERHFDQSKKEPEKFMYLRRTGVEAQSIARPEACPFKKYNANEGYEISADYNGTLGFGNFYLDEDQTQHIGYCAALSTFSNLRGIDFSDVAFLLYDECIPENKNKHVLKDEGFLFLNVLETINRNRALSGETELVVCLLSNAIDLASVLLSQLNFTSIMNSMIFKHQQKYTDVSRSLHIEKYVDHVVSKEKGEKSMLYKFSRGTGFNEQALSGNFVQNDLTVVRKANLNEYTSFLTLENVCVYKHKSDELYYISQVCTPSKYTFRAYESEKVRQVFYWLYKVLVVDRKVYYDSLATKAVFDAMIRYKQPL